MITVSVNQETILEICTGSHILTNGGEYYAEWEELTRDQQEHYEQLSNSLESLTSTNNSYDLSFNFPSSQQQLQLIQRKAS